MGLWQSLGTSGLTSYGLQVILKSHRACFGTQLYLMGNAALEAAQYLYLISNLLPSLLFFFPPFPSFLLSFLLSPSSPLPVLFLVIAAAATTTTIFVILLFKREVG